MNSGRNRPDGVHSLEVTAFLFLCAMQDGELRVFPRDNPWNWDVSRHRVHAKSDVYLRSIGLDGTLHADFGTVWNGAPNGLPYVIVGGKQKRVPVEFEYASESDPGPYPIPDDAPVEGGPNATGDRHVIVIDRDHRKLYELFHAFRTEKGWRAGSGAVFDLDSNDVRPDGWTSADAAGLPIFPGLVRYDEVARGAIPHAIRFTARRTRKAHLWPARHHASRDDDPSLPPMGLRLRLKASFDISRFPKSCQVILTALKLHGMFLADNGSDWYLSGATDRRWKDAELRTLSRVKGRDFEVVETVDESGNPIPPKK